MAPVSTLRVVETRPAKPDRRTSGPSMRRSASACNCFAWKSSRAPFTDPALERTQRNASA